jgi:uncharacterized protein YjbJ (UPF0337 family)
LAAVLIKETFRGTEDRRALFSTVNKVSKMEKMMDKDRIAGGAKKVSGAIKESVGRATGDQQTEAEGKKDKAEGRAQSAVGHAKDAAREILKKE